MLAYLVEWVPKPLEDRAVRALAARVAHSFGPRPDRRLASSLTLLALSRRRLGVVRGSPAVEERPD